MQVSTVPLVCVLCCNLFRGSSQKTECSTLEQTSTRSKMRPLTEGCFACNVLGLDQKKTLANQREQKKKDKKKNKRKTMSSYSQGATYCNSRF